MTALNTIFVKNVLACKLVAQKLVDPLVILEKDFPCLQCELQSINLQTYMPCRDSRYLLPNTR